MLFNSIEFILFFPIVTILFYLIPHPYRWIHLLVASCIFYMFFIPQYIFILFTTIIIDYLAAILIEKSNEIRKKKSYLIISIVATCVVLIVFKYVDFLNENMLMLSHKFGFYYPERVIHIVLPIGLSFHTFQSLSYVIEVYRGNQRAEKHFGIYALYVMFYPQLVTGPIERPQNLLVQLREKKSFEYSNLVEGLRLILFGLLMKMVVADHLGVYVDEVYSNPGAFHSLSILTGLFFYSFQIYCDFYGYSSIAVGCAKAMGYNLMDNFRNPYSSASLSEFWQRWHISLSSWFRDYIYFPLGGNRVKVPRWIMNILIVFALSGLWHGANWTFVIWGLAHGTILVLENLIHRILKFSHAGDRYGFRNVLHILKTFTIVSFLWVFFRAPGLHQVKIVFQSILDNFHTTDHFHVARKVWLFLILFILVDRVLLNTRFDRWCSNRSLLSRWAIYTIMIYLVIVYSNVDHTPFIYFQF